MKAMIGQGVYLKPDMVSWMQSGIAENFPPEADVRWYLEAPDKDMIDAMGDIPFTYGMEHILEHGVHRHFINLFLASDCDVLIIPQDDNRFERPLLPDLQRLWEQYGETLGWISGRDGYDFGYQSMVCSPFSDSNSTKIKLDIGNHWPVRMMNTGPVVYFRHVIERVGLPDPDLAWFWWDDMALKCDHAGLKNILLSMDCKHEKFGRIGNNPGLFDDKLVADCLRRFNERWKPIYGRNPL